MHLTELSLIYYENLQPKKAIIEASVIRFLIHNRILQNATIDETNIRPPGISVLIERIRQCLCHFS